MWPNLEETADFFIFTEEIFNGKPYFFCAMFIKRSAYEEL